MSPVFKKTVVWLVLLSFLAILFFSFVPMTHESDGSMSSDCPFSALGTTVCPQDIVATAAHHISAYQTLLQVIVPYGMLTLLVSFLLIVFSVLIARLLSPPSAFSVQDISRPAVPSFASRYQKIIRWLSLLEHSPSLP